MYMMYKYKETSANWWAKKLRALQPLQHCNRQHRNKRSKAEIECQQIGQPR